MNGRGREDRTGVWLIGARGSVATTVVAGCAAVVAGLHPPTGMITETEPFAGVPLPPLPSLVFGGHDTASDPLPKRADELAAGGVLPYGLPRAVHAELSAADESIRPGGPQPGETRTDEELITAFATDLRAFVRTHALTRAVVINVASTEPAASAEPPTSAGPAALAGPPTSAGPAASTESAGPSAPAGPVDDRLPPSSLYAYAALRAGCPYVNFTPFTGLHHPLLHQMAICSGLPYAGRDGKTGQTLLRSVLAPMFAQRALAVRAWSGTNLLGGGDGAALTDPAAATAKNAGKARVLADTLGGLPPGDVHIDNVPALGDWKTAWDHIAFEGFLGNRMVLQTTWQGCDSALAAPLVLDLARLVAAAHAAGLSGPLPLGFYFKDPYGGPSALADQYAALLTFAHHLRARP
ncbi:inositol-3-phosphate synthase [Streptomyces sp. MST-110588]|uniref:inositol-3-phosphate synthase n=1 Tax=Streptomyces sp. MST-110588 TaxID=2833628 RepID=UPI001F5C8DF2|nr:inositol-3-phosphate synthase [Streptomyces sp. MST-110588]UNO42974.1 inositol-3-phosphate synthase [Streptomyces sp. MST-110588]